MWRRRGVRTVNAESVATDAEVTRLLNELEQALDRMERATEKGLCDGSD